MKKQKPPPFKQLSETEQKQEILEFDEIENYRDMTFLEKKTAILEKVSRADEILKFNGGNDYAARIEVFKENYLRLLKVEEATEKVGFLDSYRIENMFLEEAVRKEILMNSTNLEERMQALKGFCYE
jgi:hypothetical protein